MMTSIGFDASSLLLPWVNERATLAAAAHQQCRDEGETNAQTAIDRWLSCPRHRAALDRPGYRRDQMARVELHDQPDPMGRIRRRAGRGRPDPDLARQALIWHALVAAKHHLDDNHENGTLQSQRQGGDRHRRQWRYWPWDGARTGGGRCRCRDRRTQ